MKILLTTDTYFPMINGVVISTSNLYKELKIKGHEVRILTLSDKWESRIEGDIYYLRSTSVRVYPGARIASPFFNPILKEIMEWKPDIIHSQTEFSTMIPAKIMAKKLGIPHIHTYHTMYEDYLNYFLGGKVLKKNTAAKLTSILLNSIDGIITPTKKVEKTLIDYGVTSNTYVIPTGIDLTKFKKKISKEEKKEILVKHNIPQEGKNLIYVGRIAEEKNIEEVINFFSHSIKDMQDLKLIIVGGGPYVDKLRTYVKEMDIEGKVFFTGMVDPKEVYKYYGVGDIFVTSSTSETQGLTYVEALASGCPVVCRWDECVDNLIIKGKTGYTYTSEEEFTRAIKNIACNDELYIKMKENALLKCEEYSSVNFGMKVEDVYYTVCSEVNGYRLVV